MLQAEDSAMSEVYDHTNQSQNNYGGDCVDGDCDRKSDTCSEDHSNGDTNRGEGSDAADGNSCDAKITNNQVGAATYHKIDDG